MDGWEIKAPSPVAGREGWDPVVLEEVLQALIMADTVSPSGASGALARGVVLEAAVGWQDRPEDVSRKLNGAVKVEIAGVPVEVLECTAVRKSSAEGIKRLCKLPGVEEALARARVDLEAPRRRVKVTRRGSGHG